MRFSKRQVWIACIGTGLSLVFLYIYYQYNPAMHAWFPKCPFRSLTGLQCPGCGSQRAIHALLHGHFYEAFQQNALVPIFIPYLLAGFSFRLIEEPNEKMLRWRRILYGEWAIKIIAVVILLQFLIRNVQVDNVL